MNEIWDHIKWLHEVKAVHNRKSFIAGEVSASTLLKHTAEELQELTAAPNDIEELADTLACLFSFAITQGWKMAEVEEAMFRKLEQRFEVDESKL